MSDEERLSPEEGKLFRSALGPCLYLSQERVDVESSTSTKTAMAAIKKRTS